MAIAWPDQRSGAARILLRYSTDGALHWSMPIDVADGPVGDGNQHDHVALSYLPDGRLVAVWRDRRCCGGAFGKPFEVFARIYAANLPRLTAIRCLRPATTYSSTRWGIRAGSGSDSSLRTSWARPSGVS